VERKPSLDQHYPFATDAVLALQSLSLAVQRYAATEEDVNFRDQLLEATSGVGDTLINFRRGEGDGSWELQRGDQSLGYECFYEAAVAEVSDIVEKVGSHTSQLEMGSKTVQNFRVYKTWY
jgi:hypothetical protein